MPEERALTQWVTGEHEALLMPVEKGEGVISDDPVESGVPPAFKG
jgi:hypothetical protein